MIFLGVVVKRMPILDVCVFSLIFMIFDPIYLKKDLAVDLPIANRNQQRLVTFTEIILLKPHRGNSNRKIFY